MVTRAKLIEMKWARLSGNTPRETYWAEVADALFCAESIAGLLSNGIEVRINSEGLLLDWTAPLSGERLVFELDPGDIRTFPPTLVAEGDYEPVLSSLLFSLVQLSRAFVDVGANVGFYTVSALKMMQGVQVVSFEPNPIVFSKLKKNLSLNDCRQSADIRNLAVSNVTSGSVDFFVPKLTGSGGGSMSNLHPEEGEPVVQIVSTTTLDKELENFVEVDVIKVDVEGSELKVIQGGIQTIRDHSPTIVIELLRKWMEPFGDHPQDVVSLLKDEGYEVYAINELGCELISEITTDTVATNFVFCHWSRLEHLEEIKTRISATGS